jgi:hypothetical protein
MKQKSYKMPPKTAISGTVTAWSKAVGIDRQQLQRALSRNGVGFGERELIQAADIFKAITGDKETAMTRKILAEAEEKERANRIAVGELIAVEDAAANSIKVVGALVQDLDAMPSLVPGLTLEQRQILVGLIEACKEKARNV